MKKRIGALCAALALAAALTGCSCGNGENADLVFVNDSDSIISAVLVQFEDQSGGAQNADGSPLRRGESFGFEAGEYPVTIAVYEMPPEPFSDIGPGALAQLTIGEAPPDGERWYVRAWDGGSGLMFTVDTQWPEEVPEVTTGGGFWFPSWSLILVAVLVVPLIVLAAVCVLTLNNLEPQRRRGLFALFFTMLGLAAVLFGGAWALDENGLTWRTWFQEGMSVLLWLVGLATGILTVVYAGRWLAERGKTVKHVVVSLSALCLVSAMLMGTIAGGMWAMGPGEQVVTYDGQKAILGSWTWMGCSYELYEYHGPLVRGAGSMLVDWDRLEGAIIDVG